MGDAPYRSNGDARPLDYKPRSINWAAVLLVIVIFASWTIYKQVTSP